MSPEIIAAGANSGLLLIIAWFIKGWVADMKEHRTRDCVRLQALEKDVAFLKGRLSSGLSTDDFNN